MTSLPNAATIQGQRIPEIVRKIRLAEFRKGPEFADRQRQRLFRAAIRIDHGPWCAVWFAVDRFHYANV